MFGKLFGRGGDEAAGDPYALAAPRKRSHGVYRLRALGDTRVLALVEAADAGDWSAVKEALAPFDLGRDHLVLDELADLDGVQDWIGRAVEEDKEHRATALLISGARHVSWGWEARTSARAKEVSQEQWRTFHERLHIAEEQLFEAAELRPDWVTPWRRLLTSGRGMSLGPAVNETRLDAALRRDPLDLETHIDWISYLQPRWSGEPGEALAFARRAFARAPEGHRLGCVIPMAHIEDWVESSRHDCLDSTRIQTELREAAQRSILHADYERRPGWQHDFSIFAMALALSGEGVVGTRVFHELGGAYTSWPWTYMSDPEKAYARFRRHV
ncbi:MULTISPECIES: hypothetical protein [unclassified Streptomyces]|uniref:hypothetical protein n=1 Tax=unclassified Streptomyces TaxID=2593676 RepID=UPI000DBA924A|nr:MULTISPECIES: hypothetical protein [unclassified Streptomyces]MYT74581.1 hypothetical protein [Streptomyces sp. SID8367]RAJ91565.1 hypothetical protein K377_00333 [Streptomyces sp. PsTaAH-137]